jgi:hypothetical protein
MIINTITPEQFKLSERFYGKKEAQKTRTTSGT